MAIFNIAGIFRKKRRPNFNPSLDVYEYAGIQPDDIEDFVDNSNSLNAGLNKAVDFTIGYGVPVINSIMVNDKQTGYEFIRQLARDLILYNGVFIHRNLDANGVTKSLQVLPFAQCRVGKKDDNNYNGKIYQFEDFTNKEKKKEFYVWSDNKKVIEAQFLEKGDRHTGQVLFINNDYPYIYPKFRVLPVIKDIQAEISAARYKAEQSTNGFFGKHIFIVPPFEDSLLKPDDPKRLEQAQKRDEIKTAIENMIGVDNVGSALLIELEFNDIDDLNKAIGHIEIKSDINDSVFEYTEKSVRNNILMRFKVPELLVSTVDNGIFGNSGELLKQAKIHLQESLERERTQVEQILAKVFKDWHEPLDTDFKIVNLIQNEVINQ